MTIYITEMLRWGEPETHHYIVGAYSSREQASLAGDIEEAWRGGKYTSSVKIFEVDEQIPEDKIRYYQERVE